jgi:putative hydrolase of the HAD superfamily
MIKAVIFDYEGVIKTSHPLSMDISRITGLSEEELLKTKEKRHQIASLATKGVISDEQFWQEFSKVLNKQLLSDECVEKAKQIYRDTFEFFSEVISLVEELKQRKIKTAVLSNIFKFEADVIRERNGYDEFDPVILSYEAEMRKPDAEIYNLILKKLGLRPEECIFIDDQEKNLLPAKELGMKTILFQNPKQAVQDIFYMINAG